MSRRGAGSVKRVLLVGEGPNDIGRWGRSRSYRDGYEWDGVVGAWLRLLAPDVARITDGLEWKHIRKFRVRKGGAPVDRDAYNVRALPLEAMRVGCDAVVFVRDRDGNIGRAAAIEEALAEDACSNVAGGVAVESLEHWLAAATGLRKSETKSTKQVHKHLTERGCTLKSTEALCSLALDNSPVLAPECAESLHVWVARVLHVIAAA